MAELLRRPKRAAEEACEGVVGAESKGRSSTGVARAGRPRWKQTRRVKVPFSVIERDQLWFGEESRLP